MLHNYLITTWRLLVRQRVYAIINVAGLALGMASCLVLSLYAQHELSFDRFHANSDRLYRVITGDNAASSGRLADLVASSFGQRVQAARKVGQAATVLTPDGELVRERRIDRVDPSFLEIFSFAGLQGDLSSALDAPDAIVLTERMARKYFPKADALDQVLSVDGRPRRVTAVLETPPSNSHLQFDALLPLATLAPSWFEMPWFVLSCSTYLLLPEDASAPEFSRELNSLVSAAGGKDLQLSLQRVTDIHLHSHLRYDVSTNGDVGHVLLVCGIAAVVLLLACINYVNLSTARLRDRTREVGVRKAIGAARRQLVLQFLGESILTATFAMALAAGLVELFLPTANRLLGTRLSVDYAAPAQLLPYATLILLVGLGAGGLAASRMASAPPVAALAQSAAIGGRGRAAMGLVIFQFTASICLMACAAIVQRQVRSLEAWDLGFDSAGVVVIDNSWNALGDGYAAFKAAALTHLGVESLSAGTMPCFFSGRTLTWNDADGAEIRISDAEADRGYVETLKLRLLAGRGFSDTDGEDDTDVCVVNEAYARAFPGTDGELARGHGFCRRVVGVVADFPAFSLREEIGPVSILLRPGPQPDILVRLDPSRQQGALDHLKATWQRLAPDRPFEYSFLSTDLASLYADDRRLGHLVAAFTGLALAIGCLGVFGLAAHAATTRRKEVGVRRVLGASTAGIAWLMTRRFTTVVALSTALATPIAVLIMRWWLSGFSHRTEIEPALFLYCGGGALLLALATVSTQTIRASLANPVDALRCE